MQLKKIDQLDTLRFFAVFAVLMTHWHLADAFPKVSFLLGSNGVNLFFALSGFLITLILLKTKEATDFTLGKSLRNFYVRRILRIFPIYYLMLVLLWFFNHGMVAEGMPWYMSYLTNFYCIKIQDFSRMAHLWSLSLEEQFYLVWPLVILLVPVRKTWIPIVIIIVLSVISKLVLHLSGSNFWMLYMNPIGVFDILGLGALLAYCYHFHQEKLKGVLYSGPVIALILIQCVACLFMAFSPELDPYYNVFSRFSLGLLFIWIIGRSAFGFDGWVGKLLMLKPLRYIGKISYGVYLFHLLVPGMLLGVKYPENVFLRFLIYLAVTILISSVSWFLFEKRILKLKDKFS